MAPLKTEPSLIKTLPAEGISPAELFQMLDWPGPSFLFNGSKGGWFDGDYSLLGALPFGRFRSKRRTHRFDGLIPGRQRTTYSTGDPLEALQHWLDRFQITPFESESSAQLPLPTGGAIGFFSYELARQFERLPETTDTDDFPDIDLLFVHFYVMMDHRQDLIHLVYNPQPEIQMGCPSATVFEKGYEALRSLEEKVIRARQRGAPDTLPKSQGINDAQPITATTDCSEKTYQEMVHRAKTYIAAGDIFQANLSHQFSAPCPFNSLFSLYTRLWKINPSPFSCYLDFADLQIASASPERLVRIRTENGKRIAETRPIAGTRPRGGDAPQDKALVSSLYQSEKERAEHLMLVDLERNDLGRVCKYGSITVDALMALEQYSHVSHLVSNIRGELAEGITPLNTLKALFPGGTITGVPKIRCMEIISELEQKARGLYTGAIGYIGFDGDMDLNIAIRTWVRHKDRMMFRVGAGIVADSDPEKEYQETLQKAAALTAALHPEHRRG
ncbi:MAG: anthranilate synthase component I family protein [Nitrospiria bacterium]